MPSTKGRRRRRTTEWRCGRASPISVLRFACKDAFTRRPRGDGVNIYPQTYLIHLILVRSITFNREIHRRGFNQELCICSKRLMAPSRMEGRWKRAALTSSPDKDSRCSLMSRARSGRSSSAECSLLKTSLVKLTLEPPEARQSDFDTNRRGTRLVDDDNHQPTSTASRWRQDTASHLGADIHTLL